MAKSGNIIKIEDHHCFLTKGALTTGALTKDALTGALKEARLTLSIPGGLKKRKKNVIQNEKDKQSIKNSKVKMCTSFTKEHVKQT